MHLSGVYLKIPPISNTNTIVSNFLGKPPNITRTLEPVVMKFGNNILQHPAAHHLVSDAILSTVSRATHLSVKLIKDDSLLMFCPSHNF
jgi:hypothetical protein